MLKKYAYNKMLFCFLGKKWFQNIIKDVFLDDNNSVMIELDYFEALKEEFDMELQS